MMFTGAWGLYQQRGLQLQLWSPAWSSWAHPVQSHTSGVGGLCVRCFRGVQGAMCYQNFLQTPEGDRGCAVAEAWLSIKEA